MKKGIGICVSLFLLLSLAFCSQQAVQQVEKEQAGKGPGGILKIDYTEAEGHIGENAMVCGKVLGTKEYPAFGISVVSVGTPPETPGGFHVAISEADVEKHPKDLYLDKDICITGTIVENPFGGATMTITSPSQFTDSKGKPL